MSKRGAAAAAPPPEAPLGASAPPIEFEWVPRHQLTPWGLNPNKGDVEGIMTSLQKFGWGRPIVANRHPGLEGQIIIGHHALQAAERLGMETVPVRWVNLPAKKAHALSLADNQWSTKSELDEAMLADVVGLDELAPEDWLAAGFEEKQIKALMFEAWPDAKRDIIKQRGGLNYSVIIDCEDEQQQTELLERFEAEGIKCKPWVG
jgi:hypothetical protein